MKFNLIKNLTRANVAIVTSLLSQIVTLPIILAHLSKEDYGLFLTIISLISYFSISQLGIGITSVRIIASRSSSRHKLSFVISNLFLLNILILFLVILSSAIFYFLSENFLSIGVNQEKYFIYTFTLPVFSFLIDMSAFTFVNLNFGLSRIYHNKNAEIAKHVLHPFLIYFFLNAGLGFMGFLLINPIVAFVSFYYLYRKYKSLKESRQILVSKRLIKKSYVLKIINESIPFVSIHFAGVILTSTDVIIINSFLGSSTVVAYAVYFKIVNVIRTIVWQFTDILFPAMVQITSKKFFIILNRISLNTITLAAIFLLFFGEIILELWSGGKLHIGKGLVSLFSFTLLTSTLVHNIILFQTAKQELKMTTKLSIVESILNVAISIILVLQFKNTFVIALATTLSGIPLLLYIILYGAKEQLYAISHFFKCIVFFLIGFVITSFFDMLSHFLYIEIFLMLILLVIFYSQIKRDITLIKFPLSELGN